MLTVKIDAGKAFQNVIHPVKKKAGFALADAMNKTMELIKKDQSTAIQASTRLKANRYTVNSPRIKFASRKVADFKKESKLFYAGYMADLTRKGGGTVEPHEGADYIYNPINFARGGFKQARRQPTVRSKRISKAIREAQTGKSQFFVGIPKGKKFGNPTGRNKSHNSRYFGLWKRIGKGGLVTRGKNKGAPRGKIKMMVRMDKKTRHQQELFNAEQLALKTFNREFKRNLNASLNRALKGSGYKGGAVNII